MCSNLLRFGLCCYKLSRPTKPSLPFSWSHRKQPDKIVELLGMDNAHLIPFNGREALTQQSTHQSEAHDDSGAAASAANPDAQFTWVQARENTII